MHILQLVKINCYVPVATILLVHQPRVSNFNAYLIVLQLVKMNCYVPVDTKGESPHSIISMVGNGAEISRLIFGHSRYLPFKFSCTLYTP